MLEHQQVGIKEPIIFDKHHRFAQRDLIIALCIIDDMADQESKACQVQHFYFQLFADGPRKCRYISISALSIFRAIPFHKPISIGFESMSQSFAKSRAEIHLAVQYEFRIRHRGP